MIKANNKLSNKIYYNLKESFEEASFYHKVDFVDYYSISDNFRDIISKEAIRLK
jgi:hypothetical protein